MKQRLIAAIRETIAAPAPDSEDLALHAFRIYFAVYSVIDCVVGEFTQQIRLLQGRFVPPCTFEHMLLTAAVIFGAVLVCRRKNYQAGALILAAYHLLKVVAYFPLSGNHRYLEMLIYLTLAVVPVREVGKLLRYAILTIFFYSGLQKALNGYYWSGEIFALEAFHQPETVVNVFRMQLWAISHVFGLHLPNLGRDIDWSQHVLLDLPAWLDTTFKLMGRGALAAEIGLPLLVLWRRTRKPALAALMAFGIYIGIFASEYEFASTNTACLLLFYHPRHMRWALPLAFVGYRALDGITG